MFQNYNYFLPERQKNLLRKLRKLQARIESKIKNGAFAKLTRRKRQKMLLRLRRYALQLQRLGYALKLGTAGSALALALSLTTNGANAQITFTEQTGVNNPFNGVTVVFNSSPDFVDIDNDGDFDAFIGELYGTIKYYKNTSPLLPVELIDFKVQRTDGQVSLEWQTASETDNEGFEVQWTASSQQSAVSSWQTIGFVSGEGTTFEKQTYSFLHKNPAHGVNYYRLKQMDYNGAFEYSDVVSVDLTNFQNLSNLKITPNPVQNGEVTLSLPETDFEEATLEIFNSVGKLIRTEVLNANQMDIQTSDLSKGMYLFSVKINGQTMTEKVVIRN